MDLTEALDLFDVGVPQGWSCNNRLPFERFQFSPALVQQTIHEG